MSGAPLVDAVDRLYRAVVEDPEAWRSDGAFAEWLETLAADGYRIDRARARSLRQAVRMAIKLRDLWAGSDADADADPWESKVDAALGPPAWRPTLDLAMLELEDAPDPERFEDVQRRFRLVHHTPWMDGVDYAEWLASR